VDLDCNHDFYNSDCYKCHLRYVDKITEIHTDKSLKDDTGDDSE